MNDDPKTSFEDELIDRALARRAGEPREGFEQRTLARLAQAHVPPRGWFFRACAVGVPAAAVLLLAMWVLRGGDGDAVVPAPETSAPRVAEAAPPDAPVEEPEEAPVVAATPPQPQAEPRPAPREEPRVELARAPESPTFPAPSALSAQEELLLRFVRGAPRETVLAVAAAPEEPAAIRIDDLPPRRLEVEPLPALRPLFSGS